MFANGSQYANSGVNHPGALKAYIVGSLDKNNSESSFFATQADTVPIEELPLSAVGSTPRRDTKNFRHYAYQINLSNLAAGASVTLRVEGTCKTDPHSSDWYNLSLENEDITYDKEGAYKIQVNHQTDTFVRLTVVSVSSGSPSIQATFLAGN
jgi:hypothetical protein